MLNSIRTTALVLLVVIFVGKTAWGTPPSAPVRFGMAGESAMREAGKYLHLAHAQPEVSGRWAGLARIELGIAGRQVGSPLAKLLIERAQAHVEHFREYSSPWDLEDAGLLVRRALDAERHDFKVHANVVEIKRDFYGFHVLTERPPAEVEYSIPVVRKTAGTSYYNPRSSYGIPRPRVWYSSW